MKRDDRICRCPDCDWRFTGTYQSGAKALNEHTQKSHRDTFTLPDAQPDPWREYETGAKARQAKRTKILLVIAGSKRQFDRWMDERGGMPDYEVKCISRPEQLRGWSSDVEIWRVGTYWENPCYEEARMIFPQIGGSRATEQGDREMYRQEEASYYAAQKRDMIDKLRYEEMMYSTMPKYLPAEAGLTLEALRAVSAGMGNDVQTTIDQWVDPATGQLMERARYTDKNGKTYEQTRAIEIGRKAADPEPRPTPAPKARVWPSGCRAPITLGEDV